MTDERPRLPVNPDNVDREKIVRLLGQYSAADAVQDSAERRAELDRLRPALDELSEDERVVFGVCALTMGLINDRELPWGFVASSLMSEVTSFLHGESDGPGARPEPA